MRAFAGRGRRIALLLVSSFLVGGGSAEVAVRASAAIDRVRQEREIGSAGQLVLLEIASADGEVFARPRVIAPAGKPAHVVLHDAANPDEVRLAFRVEATRDPSGSIALEYALWVPERAVATRGRISLTPGVEQEMPIGGDLVASVVAVPVPSAAFDAFLESESTRRSEGKTS